MYNKKNILYLFSLLFMIMMPIHAKNLGTYGETFEIQEENLLSVIRHKLQTLTQNGGIAKHQQELACKVTHKIQNPSAVEGIQPTTTPRTWLYDPSLKIQDDIKDHQGNIIVAKGTVVNPLDTISWGVPLLFLDGDDQAQIAWAKGQDVNARWVLIKGHPLELEEQLKQPIYFDQGSMLVRKFGITQVPCRITQQDKSLKVEEIKLMGLHHD